MSLDISRMYQYVFGHYAACPESDGYTAEKHTRLRENTAALFGGILRNQGPHFRRLLKDLNNTALEALLFKPADPVEAHPVLELSAFNEAISETFKALN